MFTQLQTKIRRALSYAVKSGMVDYYRDAAPLTVQRIEQGIANSLTNALRDKIAGHANPLVRAGKKYFSQNDEDGILQEILRRLGVARGSFIELGVGDGLENNTLLLLMQGWRGGWIGGEALAFTIPDGTDNLFYERGWITLENISQLYATVLAKLGITQPDVLSIDLDGNDLHFLSNLLQTGTRPKVIIAEYNGKFPPPIEFTVTYDPHHEWKFQDWFGASLQSFTNVCNAHGYNLVACNATGINAFFVRHEDIAAFTDVAQAVSDLFIAPVEGPRFTCGHPPSPRTVASFLRGNSEAVTALGG